jgi:hypothetical protein
MSEQVKIPSVIHYVWFGRRPKGDLLERCMRTWTERLPGYTIIEWNEDNYSSTHPFFERAYREQRFGFASDLARLDILYRYGGIYLDTDVEIKKNLNIFLSTQMFVGMELPCYLSTALIGAIAGHPLLKGLLDEYDNLAAGQYVVNNSILTRYLLRHYPEFRLVNRKQILADGINVYPNEYFCIPPLWFMTGGYARHHAVNSWWDKGKRSMSKRMANFLLGDALYLRLAHYKSIRVNEFYEIYRQHNRL